jgi:hypothetical protein
MVMNAKVKEQPNQPSEPSEPPRIIPLVSTTLAVVWLEDCEAVGSTVWVAGEPRRPRTNYSVQLHYRLTPSVYAWLNRQLDRASERADAGDVAIAQSLGVMVNRWLLLRNWAEQRYGVDVLNKADPRLPETDVRQEGVRPIWDHPMLLKRAQEQERAAASGVRVEVSR